MPKATPAPRHELPEVVRRRVRDALSEALDVAEKVRSLCREYDRLDTTIETLVDDYEDDQPRLVEVQERVGFDVLQQLVAFVAYHSSEAVGGRVLAAKQLVDLREDAETVLADS
jgi:hypothetical protein